MSVWRAELPHAAPVCFGGHKLVSQHEAVLLSIANAKDLSDGMHSQEEMVLYIYIYIFEVAMYRGRPPTGESNKYG